jgi:uncharacterized membrane protein
MSSPRLLDSLPELVREGLITAEQSERIRARYAAPQEQSGNRMMLLFSILGGLLIGLGVILVVAHNWDDLSKGLRTVFAFLPMAVGQALVVFTVLKKPTSVGWKEGSSIFLMLTVGACLALVSQIYHIPGELDGFLLAWSLLTVVLLYAPGSLIAAMLYLGMITWYAVVVRTGSWISSAFPWFFLPLLALVVPAYITALRTRGASVGFFWLSLCLALSLGIGSQLFWDDGHLEIALAILGPATAYGLVPRTYKGQRLRTEAFPFLGGLAVLGVLIFLGYSDTWTELLPGRTYGLEGDTLTFIVLLAIGIVAYLVSLRWRKPLEGSWFPETLAVALLAYGAAHVSFYLAPLLINLWALAVGLHTTITGMQRDSLRRMNLGLAIVSLTIILRFFDLDISYAVKGLVFIAMGAGFLWMNVRLIKQRKKGHA